MFSGGRSASELLYYVRNALTAWTCVIEPGPHGPRESTPSPGHTGPLASGQCCLLEGMGLLSTLLPIVRTRDSRHVTAERRLILGYLRSAGRIALP